MQKTVYPHGLVTFGYLGFLRSRQGKSDNEYPQCRAQNCLKLKERGNRNIIRGDLVHHIKKGKVYHLECWKALYIDL